MRTDDVTVSQLFRKQMMHDGLTSGYCLPAVVLPSNVAWVDGRLRVRPRLGSALLWSNVSTHAIPTKSSIHLNIL